MNENGGTAYKRRPSQAWAQTTLGRILRSHGTMGYKLGNGGRIILDDDGVPIRVGPPIFTDEEFAAIQARIGERTREKTQTHGASPWLGVVYCQCGRKMGRSKYTRGEKTFAYYRCRKENMGNACGVSFREEDVNLWIDAVVVGILGELPKMEKIWIPGNNVAKELDRVARLIAELRQERQDGLYDYDGGEEEYKANLTKLIHRRSCCQSSPPRRAVTSFATRA